jgi:hypothetical protein
MLIGLPVLAGRMGACIVGGNVVGATGHDRTGLFLFSSFRASSVGILTAAGARPMRLAAIVLVLVASSAVPAAGQLCGVPQGAQTTALPQFTGTTPPDAITTGSGSNFVYVLSQWGFVRGTISPGSEMAPGFTSVVIGNEGGSGNGGLIPLRCDCHHGGNYFDAAEGSDGSSRMFSDFLTGSGDPNALFGQVARTDGTGPVRFGNQVDVPPSSATGKPGVIYVAATGKFYGYYANNVESVQIYDLTNTNGAISPQVPPSLAKIGNFSWNGPRALHADHVAGTGFDKYVMAGYFNGAIHVAEINATSGFPTETGSVAASAAPTSLFWGVVKNRIFLVAAFPYDRNFNPNPTMQVYEYPVGGGNPGALANGTIAGNFDRAVIRGAPGGAFPALIAHRTVTAGAEGYIDIYDTKFFTQAGTSRLAVSLRHEGSSTDIFDKNSFDAVLRASGPSVTAYVYRISLVSGGGSTLTPSMHVDKVDISCIAADPTAPPSALALATNTSAAARTDKTNYFGDLWTLTDASSSSSSPEWSTDPIQWDFKAGGAFQADQTDPSAGLGHTFPFPCDPAGTPAGSITDGTNCWASIGSPSAAGNYQYALKATNPNGTTQYTSAAITVNPPQVAIAGFSGGALRILTGGSADASATQGNTTNANFLWHFQPTDLGSCPQPCKVVAQVPSDAVSFNLQVTYKGGFTARTSGQVQQVDLVPAFALSPNPVLASSQITIVNLMQKSAVATLTSVDSLIQAGSCGPQPAILTNPVGAAFLVGGQSTTLTAPSTAGTYCLWLNYNFLDHTGAAKSLGASGQFSTFAWQATPLVNINPIPYCLPCQIVARANYSLSDGESIPVIPHPGASWDLFDGSGGLAAHIGDSADASVAVAWQPTSSCSGCQLKVTVGGKSAQVPVEISGATGEFFTLVPCRVADTRTPTAPYGGPSLGGGTDRSFVLWGQCGIPPEARAVSVTVTVTNTHASGDVRVVPAGIPLPLVSTLNWRTGQTRSNNSVVPLGSGGAITVHSDQNVSDASDLIIDVTGWFD